MKAWKVNRKSESVQILFCIILIFMLLGNNVYAQSLDTPNIGVDKKTGEVLSNSPNPTLTSEQEKQIVEIKEQKRQSIELLNNTNNQEKNYAVVFKEWSQENRDLVLSIENVTYIKSTTFGNEGYPTIIIKANKAAIEKIDNFDFILTAGPVTEGHAFMPKSGPASRDIINKIAPIIFSILLIIVILLGVRRWKK